MTEMFGEAWSPMSVPDLAPDDDDDDKDLLNRCCPSSTEDKALPFLLTNLPLDEIN